MKKVIFIITTTIFISCSLKQEDINQVEEINYANNDSLNTNDSLKNDRYDSLMKSINDKFNERIESTQKSIDSLKRILKNKSN